ncbi:hypothetical protein PRABACTJOHN_01710 [Parabacteroides johnsonii DSM 18315]|uniref:Uncharacterized protein n=1 Tax=Parabacteroides johnsonii DSM 18315 TaxID=537006 RepID=B7B9K8_9BACT|nr:hypothetical protein PRABACTJOHN_01710 [Parabacteroides johnsonii DSM 18315]
MNFVHILSFLSNINFFHYKSFPFRVLLHILYRRVFILLMFCLIKNIFNEGFVLKKLTNCEVLILFLSF